MRGCGGIGGGYGGSNDSGDGGGKGGGEVLARSVRGFKMFQDV